jgi:hypothetical protein
VLIAVAALASVSVTHIVVGRRHADTRIDLVSSSNVKLLCQVERLWRE